MELIDAERVAIQHGSLIGTVQLKGGKRPVRNSVRQLIELEDTRALDRLSTLQEFAGQLKLLRAKAGDLVRQWRAGKATVAAYGAARSGPTLIAQLGLGGTIGFIVDDHPQKVGKYSPGDGIRILPTAELCRRMPAYTVILAWVHAEKIIEANKEYLEKGGRFVVLCPDIRVVGRQGEERL
jgi:hypothetical protein